MTEMHEFKLEPLGEKRPLWRSWRFLLSIIGFFGFINIYAWRVGISVAIVCMVNNTALSELKSADSLETIGNVSIHAIPEACLRRMANNESSPTLDGEFVWSKSIQGQILASFFYGYLLSQIPGGLLAERFGPKNVFSIFFFGSTLFTFLTPISAQLGYIPLIICRALVGITSGGLYPAMHAFWSRYAPPDERSRLTGFCYAGAWMGNVVTLPLSGFLCENGFAGGWPSIFYVFGILSVGWFLIWLLCSANLPADHRFMSKDEKTYIAHTVVAASKPKPAPWLKILKSPAVWAIIIANGTTDWGLYTFLTNIPTYMNEVLHFNIQENGALSAIPFLGMWLIMNICPMVADKLISSGFLSKGNVRKLMLSVGSFGAAIFLIALAYIDCTQPYLAVVLLSFGVTISGCVYSGFLVNHMDIAPQYAGTLFGLSNCLAGVTGFLSPITVGALTPNRSYEEWQIVFYLSAGIYVFGAVFYCIFAKGEIEPWAVEGSILNPVA